MQIEQSTQQTQQLLELVSRFISSGTLSVVIVAMIQWLKESTNIPWINQQTTTLNKMLGAFLAFIASIGISYTYNAGTVTIVFTVTAVLAGLWHWIQQLAMQHFVYHGFIKPKAVEVIASK